MHFYTRLGLLVLLCLVSMGLSANRCHARMSVNLALDDPAYALLDKVVRSQLTLTNALTIKPITRLYAARLIAEALAQRQQEMETGRLRSPFLDEALDYLTERFKRELQQIGFLYAPRRLHAFYLAPLTDIKLDLVYAHNQFLHRDSQRLTPNLQGVFGLQEGFVPGQDVTLRLRSVSWATLSDYAALYLEPELIVRSDPLLGDTLSAGIHKGHIKGGYANVEVAFGRDTLWWGPAAQGDLALSNNAPPLDAIKVSTPESFRLPGPYSDLGAWQFTYFVARLEAERDFPHAVLSGIRVAFQPASALTFGYTNTFMAYGQGGVELRADEYLQKLFVPTFATTGQSANSLIAYDATLSVPLGGHVPFIEGLQVYWQRGHDNHQKVQGLLGGGNIIGGVVEGGRWDVRVEFTETRDLGLPWYTHSTYSSGYAFKRFILGHPLGGSAQGLYGRAQYYLSPTIWLAADGRREQYDGETQGSEITQQRYGFEASYQLPWGPRLVTLWGRFDYATLEESPSTTRAFNLRLATRWHF
ncbi:MAG: capsule assembly Wzi family protein [Candidatus Tectimicrobiota bacterium]